MKPANTNRSGAIVASAEEEEEEDYQQQGGPAAVADASDALKSNHRKEVCFRKSLWDYDNCTGRNIRWICNFGVADLPVVTAAVYDIIEPNVYHAPFDYPCVDNFSPTIFSILCTCRNSFLTFFFFFRLDLAAA